VIALGWLWAAPAAAQVEVCTAELRVDTWVEALDMVEASLEQRNIDLADRILDDVIDQLRCLATPAPPDVLGRLARQVAVVAFYQADHEEMASWTWLARDTIGGTPWPEGLEVPDRFHELVVEIHEPPLQQAEGVRLAPPKKGGFLLDGRPLSRPEARSSVQHLFQAIDKKGRVVEGLVLLGTDFPARWTEPGSGAIEVARHLPQPPEPPPWGDAVVDAPEPADPDPTDAPADPDPTDAPADPDPTADPDGTDASTDPDATEEPADPDPTEESADPDPTDEGVEPPGPTMRPPDEGPDLPGPRMVRPERPFDEIFPDCPWRTEPRKARLEGKEVVVNRQRHPVRSRDDVADTQSVFRSCGEFRAARRLGRWSRERRKLFSSGARHRDAMLRVLVAEEPVRATSRRARGKK